MPTVEHMMKKEKIDDNPQKMYMGFSAQLNDLINLYFSVMNEDEIEVKVAGDEENRKLMMPVQYITSFKDKATCESEMRLILKEFHEEHGASGGSLDPTDRMKPLDLVKIMMGVYSERANIKRFMNNTRIWAKYQDFDYDGLYTVAHATINQYYLDKVSGVSSGSVFEERSSMQSSKKRKFNE